VKIPIFQGAHYGDQTGVYLRHDRRECFRSLDRLGEGCNPYRTHRVVPAGSAGIQVPGMVKTVGVESHNSAT